MIYAVIDTNVIVSAMFAKHDDSSTVVVLKHVLSRDIQPLYNDDIIAEYREVLSRQSFSFDIKKVDKLINSLKLLGQNTARTPFPQSMLDEKDRVFYEVTLSKDNAYLVTGNQKHFPKTPIVVTPAEMLEILAKGK